MNTAISAHHSKGLKGKYPPYPAAPISNIQDMFLKTTQKHPEKIALQHKKAGFWKPITYSQLRIKPEQTASGLAAIGLQLGDKPAILGDNRPEWAIGCLAAACTEITYVTLDKDLKETEINNILRLSGAQAVICDDKSVGMILELRKQIPDLAPFKRVAKLTVCHEELGKTTTRENKRYLYTGASKKFNHEMHETYEIEKIKFRVVRVFRG